MNSAKKEGNNRVGKTRDLFKKIGGIKGIFYTKMGTVKNREGKDLTEAEEIKKRWQEYTELHKKGLNDLDNHDGLIFTQLIVGLGRSPGGGNGNLLQYSCLENPHGQRRLVGYNPWGQKELDVIE